MASALPEHPIEMFKNNIALYHNSFGTCWNVMITYLLMYSDETRNKILDVVLLRELDYTKPILQYEYLIAMRAYELVECTFTAGTILNDTIYIKKNNLNIHYKNLGISANVNLASINSKLYMNRRGTGMNLNCLYVFSCKT
jgi:hypothetical protein